MMGEARESERGEDGERAQEDGARAQEDGERAQDDVGGGLPSSTERPPMRPLAEEAPLAENRMALESA